MTEIFEIEKTQAYEATAELCEKAGLRRGQILVVGCSSSEIRGERIGSGSSVDAARAVFEGISAALRERGVFLAAQCCEHLNRAVILEKAAADKYGIDIVNVVPQPKAGGSFAATAYSRFADPVVLEEIRADAGLDIGDTLIGMHLKKVAVPVRLEHNAIGMAHIAAARTRPKFIGGERAVYNEAIK